MALYQTRDANAKATVGTSYDAAKVHTHALNGGAPLAIAGQTFRGKLETLIVQLSSVVTAATLTIRVCRDTGGDETIIPDVAATISTGVTTAADGSVAFKLDMPYVDHSANDTYYIFYKVDAGTVTVDSSAVTWSD